MQEYIMKISSALGACNLSETRLRSFASRATQLTQGSSFILLLYNDHNHQRMTWRFREANDWQDVMKMQKHVST